MGFGTKLKKILNDKGVTMTELSKRTGITYNMIKKYCSGNADPTFSYAQLIAQELELSLDDFMSYTPASDKSMLQQVFEEDFTFICGFMRNVHKFGDKPAVIDPASGTVWTYKELNKKVNMLSNALFDRHVEIGDVVLYQFPNSIEFLCCYLAPQKIGAVNSPANYHYSPEETAQCLNVSKPKVYIYDSSIAETARKALALADWTPEYILMSGKGILPHGHMRLSDFAGGYPLYNPRIEYCIWVYDESTRLYETGADGKLTGIQLFSLNEVLSAHDILMKFPVNTSDISMTLTPWFKRSGLHSGGPTSTLYAGGTVLIMHPSDCGENAGDACCDAAVEATHGGVTEEDAYGTAMAAAKCASGTIAEDSHFSTALKYIEKYHVAYLTGIAQDILRMAELKKDSSLLTDSLKGVLMVGDLSDPADYQKIQEYLCPLVISGFGTAESFWNTASACCGQEEASGFVGNSCVDDDVRVAKRLPDGRLDPMLLVARDNKEVGEIIVRSSKTSYKYIGCQSTEPHNYKDGWLYTGRLATWDKFRRITIVGKV